MRSEVKQFGYMLLLIVTMIAVILGTFVRIGFAKGQLTGGEIQDFYGVSGVIVDREGSIILDGSEYEDGTDRVWGNLIGGMGVTSMNAISDVYGRDLLPHMSFLGGMKDMTENDRHILRTTLLPLEYQQELVELMDGHDGAIFAYNYLNGEVYTALSLPSRAENWDGTAPEGSLLNKSLRCCYTPGSTFKVITTACALDQDPSLAEKTFVCEGFYDLPGKQDVVCHGDIHHGEVGMTENLSKSCNCFTADLARHLDLDQTVETLEQMGFSINSETGATHEPAKGMTEWESSRIGHLKSFNKASDVWNFIGQGTSVVSPVDMARFAGSIANGGEAANPRLVTSLQKGQDAREKSYGRASSERILREETAELVRTIWTDATDLGYRDGYGIPLDEAVTCAKTGTAQQDNGMDNRLLVGFMEETHTAFMIVVEDMEGNTNMLFDIANTLALMIPQTEE